MIGRVNGGGNLNPLQIAVSGGHTIAPAGGTSETYTWTKKDLGVPDKGIIKDVVFHQEDADDLKTKMWTSFAVKEDSITIRCYNDDAYPRTMKFRLSVLYTTE